MDNTNSIYEDIILFQKYNPKKNALNTLKSLLKNKINDLDPDEIENFDLKNIETTIFNNEELNNKVLQYLLSNNLSESIFKSFNKENDNTELLYLPFGFDNNEIKKENADFKNYLESKNYDNDQLLGINKLSNNDNELAFGGVDSLLEQWFIIEKLIKENKSQIGGNIQNYNFKINISDLKNKINSRDYENIKNEDYSLDNILPLFINSSEKIQSIKSNLVSVDNLIEKLLIIEIKIIEIAEELNQTSKYFGNNETKIENIKEIIKKIIKSIKEEAQRKAAEEA